MPSWCTTAGREGARSGGEADNSRGAPGQAGKPGAQTGMPGMSIRKQTVVDWDDGRLCVLRPALLIRF